jgi:hypothetical protein
MSQKNVFSINTMRMTVRRDRRSPLKGGIGSLKVDPDTLKVEKWTIDEVEELTYL